MGVGDEGGGGGGARDIQYFREGGRTILGGLGLGILLGDLKTL